MKNMFGRPILSAIAAAVSLLALQAQAQSVSQSAAEGGRFWFVELAGSPVADGAALGSVLAEKLAFRREAAAAGVRFSERRAFHTLFNGFSVEADAKNRLKLLRLKGVKAIYPVETITRPAVEDSGTAPNLEAAVGFTGADIAQNQFGLREPESRSGSSTPASTSTIRPSAAPARRARRGFRTPASSPATTSSVTPTTRAAAAMRSFRTRTTIPTIAPATAPTCRVSSAPTEAA